jgi:hypothetical protein
VVVSIGGHTVSGRKLSIFNSLWRHFRAFRSGPTAGIVCAPLPAGAAPDAHAGEETTMTPRKAQQRARVPRALGRETPPLQRGRQKSVLAPYTAFVDSLADSSMHRRPARRSALASRLLRRVRPASPSRRREQI